MLHVTLILVLLVCCLFELALNGAELTSPSNLQLFLSCQIVRIKLQMALGTQLANC